MELALEETFLKIDVLLNTAEEKRELQQIKSGDKDGGGDIR